MTTRQPSPAPQTSPLPSLDELREGVTGQPQGGWGGAPDPVPQGPVLAGKVSHVYPEGTATRGARRSVAPVLAGAALGTTGLAAVGLALGAEPPRCGPNRADELEAHAGVVSASLRRLAVGDALREMAVAFGLLSHRSRTFARGGAVSAVTVAPPGAEQVVTPTPPPPVRPPDPSTANGNDVDGGLRAVQPTPPTQPTRPTQTVRPRTPREPTTRRGGLRSVSPRNTPPPFEKE